MNIVWLKRDLRTQDHHLFHLAERQMEHSDYRIVYIFEHQLFELDNISLRHQQFIFHSLLDINRTLSKYSRKVDILYGDAKEIFGYLDSTFGIDTVFSYEEHGTPKSWSRDKEIKSFFSQSGIEWIEIPSDNVIRGKRDRRGWDKLWYKQISEELIVNSYSLSNSIFEIDQFQLPDELIKKLETYPSSYQAAGESNAHKYLQSFIQQRGRNYHRYISKPIESRVSCSRLSVYLAWGNLSIKQAYQRIRQSEEFDYNKRAYGAMLTRLKWRSHFIQKFETECQYAVRCINKAYEQMPYENDVQKLEAWKSGNTGIPLVDANMRCLIETGWINFRMRAMLVSVLCHHLDIDWKLGAPHLAQMFLDYEPGIHYPQVQMQAGTTGVNTVRVYNPVKQALDHDPKSVFILTWVPELKALPDQFTQCPWILTDMDQLFYNFNLGESYPIPIVDLETAGRRGRNKIWSFRERQDVKREALRILKTHTRRRSTTD